MRLLKLVPAPFAGRAAVPLALLIAVAVTGCATGSDYQEASWYGDPQAVVEDDGLPPQAPPLRRTNSGPDDPTEPFSPNYGPPLPGDNSVSTSPTISANLPPSFRRQIASAVQY